MSYQVSRKSVILKDKETSILKDPEVLKWQDELNRVFSEMKEKLEAERNQKDEEKETLLP